MKNKKIKDGILLLSVFVLSVLLLGVSTVAAEGVGLLPSRAGSPFADALGKDAATLLGAGTIPASYDLRDKKRVTGIRDQGSYGSCWAFAAACAAESSLMTEMPKRFPSADISELHLLYFGSKKLSDPLGGTAGDYIHIASPYNFLDFGNTFFSSTFVFARWVGPATESVLPYGNASPYMNVSDKTAYNDTVHLENAEWVSMQDDEYIKTVIMKKGAVATYYYCNDDRYLSKSHAYYCNKAYSANHAVAIIGWDDDFSRENFGGYSGRVKPTSDGAWLAKASYGKEYGDGGYVWISYEDVPLSNSVATSYDFALADNYEKNYQYDGGQSFSFIESPGRTGYMANTFTAKEDELLKAVSFYTVNAGTRYDVSVYTDVASSGKPGSGVRETAASTTGSFPVSGYHTVKLPKAVTLDKGSRFSVVIRLHNPTENAVMMTDTSVGIAKGISNITTAKKKQSFISEDGIVWNDLYTEPELSNTGTNLRIKAFTDNGYINTTGLALSKSTVSLSPGKAVRLHAVTTPSNATGRCTWSSSKPSVATVSDDGKVTAVACGTCVIKARSVRGQDTASCTVTVVPATVTGLKVTNVTGSSYRLAWKAAAGADRYRIYRYNAGKDSYVKVKDVTSTGYTVKNISAGVICKYKICAICGTKKEILGECSAIVKAAALTGIGKTLKVASHTGSTATLKWKKAAGASGYTVYVKSGDSYKKKASVKGCEYKVSSLTALKKYSFKVRAYIRSGSDSCESADSNTVSVTAGPAKVTGLEQVGIASTSFSVKWNAVKKADGYTVYKYNATKKKWESCGSVQSAGCRLSGLKTGKNYKIKVRAYVDASGKKRYGDYSAVIVCCTTPEKVFISGSDRKDNAVLLKWNKTTADGYELYIRAGTVGSYRLYGSYPAGKSEAQLTALSKGTTYCVKLRAFVFAGSKKQYTPYSDVLKFKL